MRSLSGYHFRDMHQVILSTEKEANTTSQTARAVCIQNNGMLCVCFSFENQICQGSSFWQSLDISGDWISNTFDDYHHVLVYFKINIALMVRENNKTSKTQRVVCVHNRAVLRAWLCSWRNFFARIVVLTSTEYIQWLLELSLTEFSGDCQKI